MLNVEAVEQSSHSETTPGTAISPDFFAYIFYTSGSTGQPKGVADNHRNVLHNIMRYTNSLRIAPEDRLTLLQSCSFSGSVSSLFCALLNGATSYPFLLRKEGAGPMADWLRNEDITIYHSVPSVFRLIATGQRDYPSLRVIRLEGDQCSPKDIDLYKEHFSDRCILVNGLGATECGIVRQFFVDKSTTTLDTVVPIGYEVEDMRVFLLDELGQEVGANAVGEIVVESEYLAQGYWHRPDLTEAAFLPHPQGDNRRIYRTGDLGRFRPNGCLDYLGRKDSQVKIRGYRIELAEIEALLDQHPLVRESAVIAREDRQGDLRLVAYAVMRRDSSLSTAEMRIFLKQKLPDYMIPSACVCLKSLPVTSTGKVDRKALPKPESLRTDSENTYVAPRTPLEEVITGIWAPLLEITSIGVHDNFFELGGDSLMAMRVIARVRQELGVDLRVACLFENQSVESFTVEVLHALMQKKQAAPDD